MNRDESLTREIARLPEYVPIGAQISLYPSEFSGGTWIGVNDASICLALINWYSMDQTGYSDSKKTGPSHSRGQIIPILLQRETTEEAASLIWDMNFARTAPFRLIMLSGSERRLTEFRWDRRVLRCFSHRWQSANWFSSGYDEAEAQRRRQHTCERWKTKMEGLLRLRQLYASHDPHPGPFSICMHRHDAATVSYTEVVMTGSAVEMRYHDGPLCRVPRPISVQELPLRVRKANLSRQIHRHL